jgi:hypothetical protein
MRLLRALCPVVGEGWEIRPKMNPAVRDEGPVEVSAGGRGSWRRCGGHGPNSRLGGRGLAAEIGEGRRNSGQIWGKGHLEQK